jgi:membrane protease YdiL (CAAX protease family)
MTILVRRHALLVYFAMAFAISWGGITSVVATIDFNLAAPQPVATGLFFVAMLLGPCMSGVILTALLEGRMGLGQLGSRLLRWRVGVSWYAIALLTAPLVLLGVLWSFSALVSPTFAPHLQWALLAVGLIAGAFEEIGWTGFATPRLLARHGVGAAGLLLGIVWAVWHTLVVFLFTFGAMGNAWIWSFAIVYIATLTPYRILMTWVYANTQSVLLAVLMHAGYTSGLLALFPATSATESLIWQAVFAALLWLAAALALRNPARAEHRRPLAVDKFQQDEATR